VYPFASVEGDGPTEEAPPTAPPGEYAYSCVARERVFEHFSHQYGTPGRLIRLSYAIDMRYGVLHDVAQKILHREPIDLAMGHANVIWQGEACDWSLRALAHCEAPTAPLNLSGPKVRIRDIAVGLGQRLGIEPILAGSAAPTAWLAVCSEAFRLYGRPQVSLDTRLDWTADWVGRGGSSVGKPTHFEARDGQF
jgi:nucleoside-diphosphate-sugar epimerase